MAAAHVTYRQVDYWLRRLSAPNASPTPGSGYQRHFTFEEATTIAVMAELVAAGVTAAVAAEIATGGPEFEQGHVQIRVNVPAVQAELQENLHAQSNQ